MLALTCGCQIVIGDLSERAELSGIGLSRPEQRCDDCGMSIVLSHRTAWLVWHAPGRPVLSERFPSTLGALVPSYPSKALVIQARILLRTLGTADCDEESIDVLVCDDAFRSCDPSVISHRCSHQLPPRSVCKIAPGIFVVSPELCFVQMGEVFSDARELVEFGCELCGCYELPPDSHGNYRERAPLASLDSLKAAIEGLTGVRGVKAARCAITYVRSGSRSPMETAHVIMLVLSKRQGGLGIRSVHMDVHVNIPDALRRLTRRGSVVCDACVLKARLDIEYNGFHHDEESRKVEDEERRNVLEAMGFHVKVLTKAASFDTWSCRRHLMSIMQIVGMRTRDLPKGIWDSQEELRLFVLRRWLGTLAGQREAA